ncbi:MAG: cell wall-binding repeat-containing protein [Oscillospiraceae bacterium]|nr:cell wall-binding repeat-containing protein [Oscillospiraceae bacterium]
MSVVVKAENVSIRYITGDFKDIGLKEYFVKKFKGEYNVTEFWADKDISFELEKGDMLGIIGTNGAGKSTLLKAVSGIMVPTEGKMIANGSIAALLELASGFDGELTVRENTYLRGAMLGYTREFMDQMYDQIIEFAELEDFQERPFKQLSSGMKSRLAFSIACLVSPDIIILDEVLSVGDGAFRKKSGDKMKEILAGGVTGILVSHSIAQVREMCNKILWLDHGKQIAFTDETTLYLDAYEEFLVTKQLPKSREEIEDLAKAFKLRKSKERKKQERTETQKLQAILEAGDSDAVVQAAMNILKRTRPDVLAPEHQGETDDLLARFLKRVTSMDRYDMSLKIADQMKIRMKSEKFKTVVLTDGEILANALSGCYLAKRNNAPLIFVDFEDIQWVMEYLYQSLEDNGKIYIIGEIEGLTDKMLTSSMNCQIIRIEGDNVYEINMSSLKEIKIDSDKILVCTGENFADSVSAIAIGLPILLVKDALTDYQIEFLKNNNGKSIDIIGGEIAVNEDIEQHLKQFGPTKRIKGRTRYNTSAVIASEFFKNPESVVLVSGKVLTDGFCSGVYAAHTGNPMLLIDKGNNAAAAEYVAKNNIKSGIIMGGESVVDNPTVNSVFGIEKKEDV